MGTINVSLDGNTITKPMTGINFALETPADVASRYGRQNNAANGRIWKMTRSTSNPLGGFDHYKTLDENHIPDGDKVFLVQV